VIGIADSRRSGAISEATSFERAEEQWRHSDIANAKKGDSSGGGGGLDGWCAKQGLN